MLQPGAVYSTMLLTLAAVAMYAIVVSRRMDVTNVKSFLSAKNSQSALRLAWCFFASGMGTWTLYSFPEIGVSAGAWGIIGYTLSGVLGLLVLAAVGPYCRSVLDDGVTFTDFVFNRFGRPMQIIVALVSLFYQFISLASEFTAIGDYAQHLAPDARPEIPIIAVVIITNVYLLIGGLRASLATDVWQGIGVVAIVIIVCIAMFVTVDVPKGAWSERKMGAFTVSGFETLVTLIIAVVASNLFYTSYWQRVFAAHDNRTLWHGAFIGSLIVIPFTVFLSFSGMVSALAYPNDPYFFGILLHMGKFWQILVAIVIASLASSVADSLQLGISAELVTNFPQLNLVWARVICASLTIPAIFIALKHYSILKLFLIADLLCTVVVGPMLLAVWPRAHSTGALAGCAVGFATVFVIGCTVQGTFVGGLEWFALPEGLYSRNSMITFVLALVLPTLTTIGVSLALPTPKPQPGSAYIPALTPLNAA